MSLQSLIETYGYWAILIGTFLEGETILVLGGFAAQLGYLNLAGVMATAFIGSFAGDQLYFYIGRRYGPGLISRRLSWQANADKVYRILERHQTFLILTFRFYYGLRNVTPFVIGASQIPKGRFFVLNGIGALIWAITVGAGGYLFGQAFQAFFDDLAIFEIYVLGALALIAVLIWITSLIRRRHRAREKLRLEGLAQRQLQEEKSGQEKRD